MASSPVSDNMFVRVMRVKNANGEERTLEFPLRLDLDRPKRARTTFSDEQLSALDQAYRKNGYLTGERRVKLAEELGLTDTQIKVWFQNRRTKDRKRKVDGSAEGSNEEGSTLSKDSTPSPVSAPAPPALPTNYSHQYISFAPTLLAPAPLPLFPLPFPLSLPYCSAPNQFVIPQSFS